MPKSGDSCLGVDIRTPSRLWLRTYAIGRSELSVVYQWC